MTQRTFPWKTFGFLATALVVHALYYFHFELDDAFISIRYAQNLTRGLGLTFNPGERVEGFTSPLAVMIEAAALWLGRSPLMAMQLFGLAAGVAIIGLTIRLALDVTDSPLAAFVAGALLIAQPWFVLDCVNGLETSLFAAMALGALGLSLSGRDRGAGLCLALAAITRPEGLLIAVILSGHLWLKGERARLVRMLLPVGVIAVPLLGAKAVYFGALVPNTALAKLPLLTWTRIESGLSYVLDASPSRWHLVALASLLFFAVHGRPMFRLLAVITGLWVLNVIYVGGDWMGPQRFLMPVLPLLLIALITLVLRFSLAGLVAAAALVVLGAWSGRADVRAWIDGVNSGTATKRELAHWLEKAAPEGAAMATFDVGVLAVESDLPIIDTGGLADRAIAQKLHEGEGLYPGHLARPVPPVSMAIGEEVMLRRPELVLLNIWGDVPELLKQFPARSGRYRQIAPVAAYAQDAGLLVNADFGRNYRWVCSRHSVELSGNSGWYNLFIRKDMTLRVQPVEDASGHPFCQFELPTGSIHIATPSSDPGTSD